MSWWEYVVRTSGTDSPKAMQARTRIEGPNFSRWKGGHTPKVEMVAAFARAYGRPVLEAFVAAGFLTAAEARQRPAAVPSVGSLANDELLDEIRKRLADVAPTTRAAGSAADVTELPTPPSASALASYARAHGVTPARVEVAVVHFAGGIGAEVSSDRLEARVTMRGHRAADLDATSPGALYDQVLQQVADWQADTSDVEDDELRKRRERAAADAAKKAARRGPVDPGDED